MRAADYACALIVQDGRVLLGRRAAHRKAYPNCWDVIGGKIEAGESREAALVRELGEEIGIAPVQPEFVETLCDTAMNDAAYHMFKVTRWTGGAPHMLNHEHSDLEWFSMQKACDLDNLALEAYRELFERVLGTP